MNLEKFEEEELRRIKKTWHYDPVVGDDPMLKLVSAFESAMAALRKERERCAKIAENNLSFSSRPQDYGPEIAEEIRSGK